MDAVEAIAVVLGGALAVAGAALTFVMRLRARERQESERDAETIAALSAQLQACYRPLRRLVALEAMMRVMRD